MHDIYRTDNCLLCSTWMDLDIYFNIMSMCRIFPLYGCSLSYLESGSYFSYFEVVLKICFLINLYLSVAAKMKYLHCEEYFSCLVQTYFPTSDCHAARLTVQPVLFCTSIDFEMRLKLGELSILMCTYSKWILIQSELCAFCFESKRCILSEINEIVSLKSSR